MDTYIDSQVQIFMDYAIRPAFWRTQLFTWWQIDTISCVLTDRKSLSSCVSSVQEVNEVAAHAQRRALWSAENEALPQRKALWSAESEAKNHSEISDFLTFLLYLD